MSPVTDGIRDQDDSEVWNRDRLASPLQGDKRRRPGDNRSYGFAAAGNVGPGKASFSAKSHRAQLASLTIREIRTLTDRQPFACNARSCLLLSQRGAQNACQDRCSGRGHAECRVDHFCSLSCLLGAPIQLIEAGSGKPRRVPVRRLYGELPKLGRLFAGRPWERPMRWHASNAVILNCSCNVGAGWQQKSQAPEGPGFLMVRSRRLELPRLATQRPQPCASTNSATTASW